ncbi:MAG: Clp protease ClpP, partial [Oscillospiraceae bacterium]
MSGGSLIMCACDTVRVNPSSLVMIHKCWTLIYGGYNADELRDQAAQNDAWDKAQAAIYKRKCKLSDTAINDMMADTTYMTGREAIEKGFADELLEDAEPLDIAASADGRSLFVRGKKMHLAPGMFATDKIPTVSPADEAAEINTKLPGIPGGQEGGKKPMAKTIEELRVEYPALTKQLEEEAQAAAKAPGTDETAVRAAVEAERTRQQEIDSISASIDPELVREAKFGEKACSAQELAFRAMKRQAELGEQHLAGVADDATASGGAAVAASASPADDKPSTKQEIEAQAKADAEAYAKEKEGK